MKKFAYVVAAIASIAVAAPTIASAQSVVIKSGHGHMGMRDHHRHGGWRHHEGWRHHHHDKVVIVKHRH